MDNQCKTCLFCIKGPLFNPYIPSLKEGYKCLIWNFNIQNICTEKCNSYIQQLRHKDAE